LPEDDALLIPSAILRFDLDLSRFVTVIPRHMSPEGRYYGQFELIK